jgi:YggT family protein
MLAEIGLLILQTLLGGCAALFLLRAWAFATNAPMRQPIGEFTMRLTDWAVLPARRVLPKTAWVDWASVLLAYIAAFVFVLCVALLFGSFGKWFSMPLMAFLLLARWAIWLLIGVLIVQAILSWTQTNAVAARFAALLTDPLLRPIRRVVPMVGPVDLSPLVLIVLANIALIVVARLPGLL